ncbi:cbb3-type cytochrome c oxidase subunit I [Candidatus Villigracilis saccharophilus]|uniref:cytochrome c oxidase subunit I n=1 Tax=Candidatus Villigracilis saccharophilus TaxID=3140684 RepID=UPI0031368987|nr:cbb3-type cytochrome c oxidase subunit I [Anaerolineales bacterium]
MKNFFSTALARGLFWQLIGTLVGAGLVTGIRAAMGLSTTDTFFFTEPAWVLGAFFGVLFFIGGSGIVTDWFKWARGIDTPEHHEDHLTGWQKYLSVSLDHKVIGVQYTVTAFVTLGLGGIFALIFRTELAASQLQFLTVDMKLFGQNGPQLYNTLMSLHGMVMIVSILLGIAGIMNYVVPLLLGAQDMAFPRLNAFSYWIAVPAAVLLIMSLILGGFDTGWTGYPPLSVRAPVGVQMFFLGVFTAGWSSILGALNVIVTVVRMRSKGMTAMRMPILVWASIATSIISLTATQLIGLSFQLVMFQRLLGMGFFDPAKGGNPVLFQHLFWFYSHPAVYVFVLPGLGVISELLPVFARKPLFGYRWIAMSSLGIALVGFLVWAHHMFTSGMNEYLRVPFMYSTLLVAVPTGVKFFSWLATIWKGKLSYETPLLFVIGAIVVFLMGGLTGPPNATVSVDLHLHDTYFIVGHFHDTIFGGFVFPFFAAVYYWFPKATGRRMNETLGKIHFWIMTPSFFVMTLGMMRIGLLGMRRRIADYDPAMGFDSTHLILTITGYLIFISVCVFIYNFFNSIKNGEKAEGNVWNSRSPEWQVPSPMPAHNYDQPFEVVGEPYDYGLPGSKYVEFSAPTKSKHK